MQLETYSDSQISEHEPKEKIVLRARSELSDRLATITGIVECYLRIKAAEPICAIDINPQPETRSLKWTVNGCHYVCDIESCLRRFLVNRPDRITLRQAWESLLSRDDYSRISADEKTLIMSLAPAMERIGLQPHLYFKRIKRRGRA